MFAYTKAGFLMTRLFNSIKASLVIKYEKIILTYFSILFRNVILTYIFSSKRAKNKLEKYVYCLERVYLKKGEEGAFSISF